MGIWVGISINGYKGNITNDIPNIDIITCITSTSYGKNINDIDVNNTEYDIDYKGNNSNYNTDNKNNTDNTDNNINAVINNNPNNNIIAKGNRNDNR